MKSPAEKTARTVVAIPAKDEACLIGPCLLALARQNELADDIVVFVNNTKDRTADIARGFANALGSRLHVRDVTLPPAQANAGTVRRLAMDLAADIAGSQGVILTTDADGQVSGDWVASNLAWLRSGYDAVCGMAAIDPADEILIPAHLIADDLAETRYTMLLDEIDHWIDPRPWDPWPRHTHRSGASIAVRSAVYTMVGGLPHVSHGEDRGFVEKLERRDCKVRHDTAIVVTVSGRRLGRAIGGMAETIARRMVRQDDWADDRLEKPQAALRRIRLRRDARALWSSPCNGRALAAELLVPEARLAAIMRSPWFGQAWAEIEVASPVLRRIPIAMTALRDAIAEAEPILCRLRQSAGSAAVRTTDKRDDLRALAL